MLSDRRQRILSALIREYIERPLPVGSRTLAERYCLGVSPATVRNDLSALEDAGFIVQPHTSAGRVPTDAGYRAFVDDLLASDELGPEGTYEQAIADMRQSASEVDDLLERTGAALARLTDCLTIVAAPTLLSARIRQLSVVSLGEHQALVVVVTEEGQVVSRPVILPEAATAEQLASVQELLNRVLAGCASGEARCRIDQGDLEELREPLARLVVEEAVLCLEEDHAARTHKLGMSALLRKPEFSDAAALAPLMDALEDDSALIGTLEEATGGEGRLMVRIGSENGSDDLSCLSVVAGGYGRSEAEGIVCVVGPTRMDYTRVIAAVRAAQAVLRGQ